MPAGVTTSPVTASPVVRPIRGPGPNPDRDLSRSLPDTGTAGAHVNSSRRRLSDRDNRRVRRSGRRVRRRLLAGAVLGGVALAMTVPAVRAAALPSAAPTPAPTFPAPCTPGVGGPGGCLPGPTPSLPGLPSPRPTSTSGPPTAGPTTAGTPTAPADPTDPTESPGGTPSSGSGPSAPAPVVPPEVDQPGGVSGWIARGISAAIGGFFRDLVTSALNPLLNLLGRTLLTTPTPEQLPRVGELWESGRQFTVAAYVLLVIIAGITVMAHGTVQTRYGIKEIAPRVVVGFLAANMSLLVCGQAIRFANAASAAALGDGIDPDSAATTLSTLIASPLAQANGLFVILLGLVLGGMLVALLVGYVVRVALAVCLIVAAAPAVACYGTPWTEGVARWWGRAFLGVLAIEVVQSVALVTAVRVFFAPGGWTAFGPNADGLVNLLVALALVYILIKIPFWVLHQVRAGGGRSFVGSLARGFIAYKAFGALRGRGTRAAGRAGPGRSGPGRPGGPPGPAGPGPGPAGGGTRPRPRPGGGRGGGHPAGRTGDPYERVRTDSTGQTLLPLNGLRRGRLPTPGPTPRRAPPASPPGRRPARGRQLRLPLDGQWPQDRPVLQADGQYRLPISVPRVRRPTGSDPRVRPAGATAAGTGTVRGRTPPPRTAGRTAALPPDPYAGLRPERGGQYRIPLDGVTRAPRRTQAPPATPRTAPPRPGSPPTGSPSTGSPRAGSPIAGSQRAGSPRLVPPAAAASTTPARPDRAAPGRTPAPGSAPVERPPRRRAGRQLLLPLDLPTAPARPAARPPAPPTGPRPAGRTRPAGSTPRTAGPRPADGGTR